MPVNQFLNEPNDGSSDAPNDAAEPSSVIRPETTKPRFDPTALAAASEQQLSVIRNQLRKEIKPKSFIENIYGDDLAYIMWDIRQLREIKNSLLRYEMQPALRAILEHVLTNTEFFHDSLNKAKVKTLAAGWYSNKKDQAQVEKILTQFNLNEKNIEAEAWRRLSAYLDVLERQLTMLETRRDKTIKALADFRDGLSQRLKLKVQQIIEADEPFEAYASPNADESGAYSRLS